MGLWAAFGSMKVKVSYELFVHLKGSPRLKDVTLHVQANIVLAQEC